MTLHAVCNEDVFKCEADNSGELKFFFRLFNLVWAGRRPDGSVQMPMRLNYQLSCSRIVYLTFKLNCKELYLLQMIH